MKYFRFLFLIPMLVVLLAGCGDDSPTGDTVDTTPVEFFDVDLQGIVNVSETAFSYDGSMIAVVGDLPGGSSRTRVYDTKSKTQLCEFSMSGTNTYGILKNFSNDGSKLLIDNFVVNPRTGDTIQKFSNANPKRILPDGSTVVALSSTYTTTTISLYSVADGSKIKDLQINESAGFGIAGTHGSNQIILMSNPQYNAVRVVTWDIASNTKLGDFTVADCEFLNGGAFSSDFSVISLANFPNDNIRNFYNTLTGEKINKNDFIYPTDSQGLYGSLALANDLTFMTQPFYTATRDIQPPAVYSISNGKRIKSLTLPAPANERRMHEFVYSGDSRFFSARGYVSSIDRNLISIRIWKLK